MGIADQINALKEGADEALSEHRIEELEAKLKGVIAFLQA